MEHATINLPPDLLEKLKEVAEARNASVDLVIREALEEKVGERPPRPRSLGLGSSGVSDTARLTGEERPIPRAWR